MKDSATIELKEPGVGVPRDISSSPAAEAGGAVVVCDMVQRVLQGRQGA